MYKFKMGGQLVCSYPHIRKLNTHWLECLSIDGLQSIPRDSNNKDVMAMLEELTIEANEASFVIALQH